MTMTAERSFNLQINGRQIVVDNAGLTLLDVLRAEPGLSGGGSGCISGICGACTVLADGFPVLACLTMAHSVAASTLVTIDGLTEDAELRRLREAVVARALPDCGSCVPGMLLCAVALLAANPRPTRDDVKLAFAGNLCRCLGYGSFVDAVLSAAALSSGSAEEIPA